MRPSCPKSWIFDLLRQFWLSDLLVILNSHKQLFCTVNETKQSRTAIHQCLLVKHFLFSAAITSISIGAKAISHLQVICLILLVSFKMIWHIIACHCFEVNTKMASLVLPDQFKISLTFWDISNIDLFSLMLLLQMFTHQTPVVNLNLTIWLSCLTLVVCNMKRLVEC